MRNFQEVEGLDLDTALKAVDFPVVKEDLQTEAGQKVCRSLLTRTDTGEKLGIVSSKRPILRYGEMVETLTEEFARAGLSYKLRESSLYGKHHNLYQEYLFDQEIESPDGEEMSPMAIIRGSYVGAPMNLNFGSFRFTCKNGAMIGKVVGQIKIGAKAERILSSSLRDDIQYNLNRFATVSQLYKKLEEESMHPYLQLIFADAYVSTGIKKLVLESMQENGYVSILKEKVRKEDFGKDLKELFEVKQEVSAWVLYNVMTAVATHKPRTAQGRFMGYKQISQIFGI